MNKETDESIKENILLPSFFNLFFSFFLTRVRMNAAFWRQSVIRNGNFWVKI